MPLLDYVAKNKNRRWEEYAKKRQKRLISRFYKQFETEGGFGNIAKPLLRDKVPKVDTFQGWPKRKVKQMRFTQFA